MSPLSTFSVSVFIVKLTIDYKIISFKNVKFQLKPSAIFVYLCCPRGWEMLGFYVLPVPTLCCLSWAGLDSVRLSPGRSPSACTQQE